MQFTTATILAFLASAAIAAPAEPQLLRFPGQPIPKSGTLAARSEEDATVHKRIGPVALAIISGSVSGSVSGFVGSWLRSKLGGGKRSVEAVYSKPVDEWTFDDAREAFAKGAVNSLFDVAEDEAAICVSVAYTVNHPGKTREAASVAIEADGQSADFDCFLLAGPSTFTVVGEVTDATVAVKPGPGTFENGVLTLL